jgi:hypothetical protein
LAGKLPREADKSIVLEAKIEEILYRKIALRLTYQSPGADLRNCRGILETQKNAKGCCQSLFI